MAYFIQARRPLAQVSLAAVAAALAVSGAQAQEPVPAPAEDQGISDIIVTAQRRSESVQKSSLAIDVLSAEAITNAGMTGPGDISTLVSGVNIAQAGPATQTFVRGVGSFSTNSYAEGAIAYNLDGFYIARPTAVYGNFYDLERIEVLKGPQGTLYGRNATGGAINLITKKPRLGEYGGEVGLEAGNYDLIKANGAANIPIGDSSALRAAFQIVHRDGYLSDGYDDEKSQAARLQFYTEPSDQVSLLVSGSYSHLGGRGPGTVRIPNQSGYAWTGGADSSGLGQPGDTCLFDPVQNALGCGTLLPLQQDGFVDNDIYSVTAELNVDLGFAKLTVMPGYRRLDGRYRTYVPGFLFETTETSNQLSLETRLGGESDSLKWVLGGYLYREDQTQHFYVNQGVNQTGADTPKLDTDSWAVFGQLTYSLTDSLRVIGGLRYTYEKKAQAGTESITAGPPTFLVAYPYITLPISGEVSARRLNFKAGFEYDLSPDNMLFATVATGFKGGGVINALVSNTFPPEKLTAYELGLRNRFLDNTVQLNLEAFYWKYKDKQEGGIRFTPQDGVAFLITPADATLYGLDVDLTWKPSRSDTFNIGGEYLHSEYDDYRYTGFVATVNPARTSCGLNFANAPAVTVDCSGKQLPKAPKWSGNASYEHRFFLNGGSTIAFQAMAQFSSSYRLNVDYIPTGEDRQESYVTFDANLSYTDPSDRLTVTVWGKNLTKKAVLTGGIQEPFKDTIFYSSIRPPRTYGVRVGFKY
jgi:iron complex outermembrane receptor protein